MSRSYRKHPIWSYYLPYSEKRYRQGEPRRWRAGLRQALAHERYERAAYDVPGNAWDWRRGLRS